MKDPATTSGTPFLPLPGCIVAMRASIAAYTTTERKPVATLDSLVVGVWEHNMFQCKVLHVDLQLTGTRRPTWWDPWLCCTAIATSMQCSPAASNCNISTAMAVYICRSAVPDRSKLS